MSDLLTSISFMQHALRLAARNIGQTWPNPAVGALLVKNHHIIGRGWTARGGRPHAEPQAIVSAGTSAQGATLYVTLEPCAHTGKTPPCTQAIIQADIQKVVIACRDPDPRVNGKGVSQLKDAGIEVIEGICEEEAKALNAGFFLKVTQNRPFVTVKAASSADGYMAYAPSAMKRWITNAQSRAHGHYLRATHDAILTGIGTVLADNPELTCRLPGLEDRSPMRVVLDSKGKLPPDCNLIQTTAKAPLWVLSLVSGNNEIVRQLPSLNISDILHYLSEKGITRLLVEGGPTITSSFINSGLVDELYWYKAPFFLQEQGSARAESLLKLPENPRFTLAKRTRFGDDALEVYRCLPD